MRFTSVLVLAFAALVAPAISASSASASGNVVASVTGAGLAQFDTQSELPFAFSARLFSDGPADGVARFDFFQFSPGTETRVAIDCVRIAQDGVILSGTIVASGNAAAVGKTGLFGAIDDDVTGDRISSVFDDLPPGADCTNAGLAVLLPVVHGIVEVRE